jgi:hypothetical protein
MNPTLQQQASAAVVAILLTTEDLNRSNAELASAISRQDSAWRPWLAFAAGVALTASLLVLATL